MKYLDKVKLKSIDKNYINEGLQINQIGRIISAEIRNNTYLVNFIDSIFYNKNTKWTEETLFNIKDDIIVDVKLEDLEVVEESDITDEDILKALPKNNPQWWCKVENGYILNLLGEKKNQIPYNYNS